MHKLCASCIFVTVTDAVPFEQHVQHALCCVSVCLVNLVCTVDCMFQFSLFSVRCCTYCHFEQWQVTVV